MRQKQPLIFEISKEGRRGYSLPGLDVPEKSLESYLPDEYIRKEQPELPEVSEGAAMRHFLSLSQRNHGVDSGLYPLGSCTMKYNPKINEEVASLPGLSRLHPFAPVQEIQGALQVMYETGKMLCEISGMDGITMQPAAGSHGELTGLMLISAYHRHYGKKRKKVIVPDSAHGTNPASATMAGFEVVQVKSNDQGDVDVDALREIVNEDTAALMLTNPSTLGLFEQGIEEIAEIIHSAGGLLYYDGANMNAIMGKARPGDMGFDVVHFNLHKTFATPHGGGGPGSGPVGVKKELIPFLPVPTVGLGEDGYYLDYKRPFTIGKVHSFYGNFGVIVKAYTYLKMMGADGLTAVSEHSVLNANYLLACLKDEYKLPYDRFCKHEFVLSGDNQKRYGVTTLDIAKRLLDYGFHPPTVYFPLTVSEALMIEPTETESKETLDDFVEAMREIAKDARENPDLVHRAPHETVVGRLDEVKAAREPDLRYQKA